MKASIRRFSTAKIANYQQVICLPNKVRGYLELLMKIVCRWNNSLKTLELEFSNHNSWQAK